MKGKNSREEGVDPERDYLTENLSCRLQTDRHSLSRGRVSPTGRATINYYFSIFLANFR